jgi:hypothetical protein
MPTLKSQFAGITGARKPVGRTRIRLRGCIESVYALDDWLHDRTQASRALTMILCTLVCATSFFIAFVGSWMRGGGVRTYTLNSLAALGASATAIVLVRRHLRTQLAAKRRKAGQCEVCGYDLRESPVRCPECGTLVPDEIDRQH